MRKLRSYNKIRRINTRCSCLYRRRPACRTIRTGLYIAWFLEGERRGVVSVAGIQDPTALEPARLHAHSQGDTVDPEIRRIEARQPAGFAKTGINNFQPPVGVTG